MATSLRRILADEWRKLFYGSSDVVEFCMSFV